MNYLKVRLKILIKLKRNLYNILYKFCRIFLKGYIFFRIYYLIQFCDEVKYFRSKTRFKSFAKGFNGRYINRYKFNNYL